MANGETLLRKNLLKKKKSNRGRMKQDKTLDNDMVDFGASLQAWKELWRVSSPQSQYWPGFCPPTHVSQLLAASGPWRGALSSWKHLQAGGLQLTSEKCKYEASAVTTRSRVPRGDLVALGS